jgi:hypothetical protein
VISTEMFKFCRRYHSLFELGRKGSVVLLSHVLSIQRAVLVLQYKFYALYSNVHQI